jgi:sugar lactone lactonase YvrE
VTRIVDTDGDGKADRYDVIAGGWPASHNYHEFTFNLVPNGDKFYLSTSVPLKGGWTYYNPGSEQAYPIPDVPGSVLELDPKTGKWSIFANGLRTPNGMGIGVDGELFVCDNQGSWLPSSKLIHVKKGGFYGHQLRPDGIQKADPPALWLPHGEISNSPSEPVLVSQGIFKGQMLFGDVTYGGIQRTNLEKIDGQYQGAVFRLTQGLEAGVNRLVWGPDGKTLYIGGIGSNGNWNHKNHRFGLQRLVPTDKTTFEMLKVNVEPDGFTIHFTEPANVDQLAKLSTYEMDSFRYEPKEFYGGPKVGIERFTPVSATPSKDGRSVKIKIAEMKEGHVFHIRLVDLKSQKGEQLWSTETWYTLNRLPKK